MTPSPLDELLRSLLANVGLEDIELPLTEPEPFKDTGLDTREVDDLLREAEGEGWVSGQRNTAAGGHSWWTHLELTVYGLRRLGQWPPRRGEHMPGRWDDGYWKTAKPVLATLDPEPPPFDFGLSGGQSDEERRTWQAWRRLLSAGLIGGELTAEGISEPRLTELGRRALTGELTDPLDRALVELQPGAKVEAMTAAVEEVLNPRLTDLAQEHDLPLETPRGRKKDYRVMANELAKDGVVRDDVRDEIGAHLTLRNKTNHGEGELVSASRIERAIVKSPEVV